MKPLCDPYRHFHVICGAKNHCSSSVSSSPSGHLDFPNAMDTADPSVVPNGIFYVSVEVSLSPWTFVDVCTYESSEAIDGDIPSKIQTRWC